MRSPYRERRKNQFSSLMTSSGIPCSGHRPRKAWCFPLQATGRYAFRVWGRSIANSRTTEPMTPTISTVVKGCSASWEPSRVVARKASDEGALRKERERQEAVSKDESEQQQQALARHINDREFTQTAKAIRRFSAPRQSKRCGRACDVH